MELEKRMGLLTRKDVMELLQISSSTVIRMEKRGELTPVKIGDGRIVRYKKDQVLKLINESDSDSDYPDTPNMSLGSR